MPLAQLSPAAAASLAVWHDAVAAGDARRLAPILHADAAFRSPAANTPYQSAAALLLVLGAALQVLEDLRYHRQLADAEGSSIVLEFSARVGDLQLKGIDFIRFDAAGLIVELEVMVRPLSGLQALAKAMGARIAKELPSHKAPGQLSDGRGRSIG